MLGKYHPHGDAAIYDAMARLVHQIPEADRPSKGEHLADMTSLWRRHKVAAALALPVTTGKSSEQPREGYVLLATRKGKVKQVTLADFLAARSTSDSPYDLRKAN